jgi:hypothetical protein
MGHTPSAVPVTVRGLDLDPLGRFRTPQRRGPSPNLSAAPPLTCTDNFLSVIKTSLYARV